MARMIAEIEAEIRALSAPDKKELLRALIGELDAPGDADVERAWLHEAQRRDRELAGGTVTVTSGDAVFDRLNQRLRG